MAGPCCASILAMAGILACGTPAVQAAPMPASACRTTYNLRDDLSDRLDGAMLDVRACLRLGVIQPRAARRALSAIATLRDGSDYDQRRGWGTLPGARVRRTRDRLDGIMRAAGFEPTAAGATS